MESEIYQISSFPWPACSTQILVVHFFAVIVTIVVGQGSDSLISSSERTPMNFFYNQVYESFFVENVSFLAVSKQTFPEEFHKEARRHYTVRHDSREGEEQNTATGQHKKPFHSWLATEGEPRIKAP